MIRNPVTLWIVLSVVAIITGLLWGFIDEKNNEGPFLLLFHGWLSSLLAVGYASTPSNSLYGKIAYGFVVVTVTGIGFKILHLAFSNELIITGLIGMLLTYVVMWLKPQLKD